MTLNPATPGQSSFVNNVKHLLNERNSVLSEITRVSFLNGHAALLCVGAFCAALSIVLLCDHIACYGWAAFFLAVSVNCFAPIVVKLIKEGGCDED